VPEVAVVAATHNRRERLFRLLAALEAQTVAPDEVFISVDGSTDGTVEALEAYDGPLPLTVIVDAAGGPAKARNRAWTRATRELIAFTDDDCEPTPGWLEALLKAYAVRPGAIVQGRTLPNPAEAHESGPFSRSLEINGLSPHFETANVLYPRAVLERLGGFDEQFSIANEDTDLGQRALKLGVDAVFAADALVHHAVHQKGAKQTLKDTFRATDCVRAYRDYPALREHLHERVYFHPSHPLLAQAAAAAVLSRKRPALALFALPYAAHLARRCRLMGAPLHAAPFLALRDSVEVAAVLRGSVRHRTLVL
jgi:GT2 family glycosyltransferase